MRISTLVEFYKPLVRLVSLSLTAVYDPQVENWLHNLRPEGSHDSNVFKGTVKMSRIQESAASLETVFECVACVRFRGGIQESAEMLSCFFPLMDFHQVLCFEPGF